MPRIIARIAVAAVLVWALPAPMASAAGLGPGQLLEQARQAWEAGRPAEALELSDQAAQVIWNQMGLGVAQAVLTREEAGGYGIYNAREDNAYAKGEPILAYLEPRGYKVASPQPGLYAFGVILDVALLSPQGEILWGKEGFFEKTLVSRRFNREFFVTVTLNLSGAPTGEYVLKLLVRDKQGGAPAEARLPVRIR